MKDNLFQNQYDVTTYILNNWNNYKIQDLFLEWNMSIPWYYEIKIHK